MFVSVYWCHLAQNTYRLRDPVNTALNFRFHKRREISLLAGRLSVCHGETRSDAAITLDFCFEHINKYN
jgi:hypothetical protein